MVTKNTRTESDSMGTVEVLMNVVLANATLLEHFAIGRDVMPAELIQAFAF